MGLDVVLRLVTVKQVEARGHIGAAARECLHNVPGQVTRAGEYRLQKRLRDVPLFHPILIQDEKAVVPGSKAPLDGKEVPKVEHVTVPNGGSGGKLCPLM